MTPYDIGWFRDPYVDGVFLVSRIDETTWGITPYEFAGDTQPTGCRTELTMEQWKRLEPVYAYR